MSPACPACLPSIHPSIHALLPPPPSSPPSVLLTGRSPPPAAIPPSPTDVMLVLVAPRGTRHPPGIDASRPSLAQVIGLPGPAANDDGPALPPSCALAAPLALAPPPPSRPTYVPPARAAPAVVPAPCAAPAASGIHSPSASPPSASARSTSRSSLASLLGLGTSPYFDTLGSSLTHATTAREDTTLPSLVPSAARHAKSSACSFDQEDEQEEELERILYQFEEHFMMPVQPPMLDLAASPPRHVVLGRGISGCGPGRSSQASSSSRGHRHGHDADPTPSTSSHPFAFDGSARLAAVCAGPPLTSPPDQPLPSPPRVAPHLPSCLTPRPKAALDLTAAQDRHDHDQDLTAPLDTKDDAIRRWRRHVYRSQLQPDRARSLPSNSRLRRRGASH